MQHRKHKQLIDSSLVNDPVSLKNNLADILAICFGHRPTQMREAAKPFYPRKQRCMNCRA